jgi:uncharacterized protein YbaR (Trm112 family)
VDVLPARGASCAARAGRDCRTSSSDGRKRRRRRAMKRDGNELPAESGTVDPELLKILACPKCKVRVELEEDRLACVRCGRRYRIEDGIPIMLIDEAEPPPAGWEPKAE